MRRVGVLTVAVVLAVLAVTPAAASKREDQALARDGLLRLDDLPAGFRQTTADDDPAHVDKVASGIPACRVYLALRRESRRLPHADAPEFSSGDATVSNRVIVYPSERRAARSMRRFLHPSVAGCVTELYDALLTEALLNDPETARLVDEVTAEVGQQSADARGDETASYSATITVRAKVGFDEHLAVESLVVRQGRVVTSFDFQADTLGFPLAGDYADAIDAALARVAAIP